MNAIRIRKNFYEFKKVHESGVATSIGFDSYTNLLNYKENLMSKLSAIQEKIDLVEALGYTEDDVVQDETVIEDLELD